jgi:Zn-dependent alcohol dehydrogenase
MTHSSSHLRPGECGLEFLEGARVSGTGKIITVEVRDEACAMSKELGADYAIDATRADPRCRFAN